jgi:hypothetical protein
LEPALAATPSRDDLDRGARDVDVGVLHPRGELVDAGSGRLQDRERRGPADEAFGSWSRATGRSGPSAARFLPA